MQVSVEELEGLERRMRVQVPAQTIDTEVHSRLQSLSRQVRLHGFRPGKVPLKMIKRLYGLQVRQEVVGEVLKSSLQEALTEKALQPAAGPKVEPMTNREGQDLEYSVTFEVLPEFEITGIEGLKVERPTVAITDADVDAMLETLRRQRTVWNPVERAARQGDRVTIDFEGKRDGEEFPSNKGENTPVVLGTSPVVRDFQDQLVGLQPGAQHEFDVSFPDDYHAAALAGRTAHFTVKVRTVEEPRLPEINEEFAAGFGVEGGGVEALRQAVRQNMERELQARIRDEIKRQVMQALLEHNAIPVPKAMVEAEVERLAGATPAAADNQDPATAARSRAALEPEAQRRVALGLIVSRLVATRNIELDNRRVQTQLENIAASYENPAQVVAWYSQQSELMEGIRLLALEEQVVDWLLEHAEVIDKPCRFDELMRPDKAQSTVS